MGTEIEIVVEKQVDGVWHTVAIPSVICRMEEPFRVQAPALTRNYERFAALAGVRGKGPEPNGLPENASGTARHLFEQNNESYAASWLDVTEAEEIFLNTERDSMTDEWQAEFGGELASFYFGVDPKQGEYRIVFWFAG